jgi:chorismate dehydratase
MNPVRLGAVSYLNTRPLVEGLDRQGDLFSLRFDVPSRCADLLHEGGIDVGLIPAIEFLRGEDAYWIVPRVAIGSDGPIASVAVFTRVPMSDVRALALDVSSRTSVALTRILCAERWRISPALVPSEPDLGRMLSRADAALVIGDPALHIDPAAEGVTKVDLGLEWKALTGLPFVYAMWCGRDRAVSARHVEALAVARDRGVAAIEGIARAEGGGDPRLEARARQYLSDNLRYGLGDREVAGLGRFHELAVGLGLAPAIRPIRFYA